jgi:hypothetical protein
MHLNAPYTRNDMKYALVILACLLLLSGCSWNDFSEGITKIKESILSPGKIETPVRNSTIQDDTVCTTDLCVRERIRSCTNTMGPLLLGNVTFNLTVTKKSTCMVQGTIIVSSESKELGRTLSCELPSAALELLPEIFTEPNLGYCGGSWYERIPTQVVHDGPIDLPRIVIRGDEVLFNITPQQHLYLRDVIITGNSFRNCSLSYRIPIKLVKGEKMPLAIACISVVGKSPRPEGAMTIIFYTNPDFKNATATKVTFTAAR